jgi:hypothetical protein
MARPKPQRFTATVQIDNGKRVVAPGGEIEPSELDPAVWGALVATGRIVETKAAAEIVADLARLNEAGQAALDKLAPSAE